MTDNIGALRQVIAIEQRDDSKDETGEPLVKWNLVATRRAEKLQTPGTEIYAAEERAGRIPTVFRIRHPRSDFAVLPKMRVTHDGKLYDIKSAHDPDGRKVELLLTCLELVGEPTT